MNPWFTGCPCRLCDPGFPLFFALPNPVFTPNKHPAWRARAILPYDTEMSSLLRVLMNVALSAALGYAFWELRDFAFRITPGYYWSLTIGLWLFFVLYILKWCD